MELLLEPRTQRKTKNKTLKYTEYTENDKQKNISQSRLGRDSCRSEDTRRHTNE